VASEERDPSSMLWCYRRLLDLRRRRPALHAGSLELLDPGPGSLVGYRRRAGEADAVDVWLNASDRPARKRLSANPSNLKMLFSTHRFSSEPRMLPSGDLHFMPYEAVVLDRSGR